MLDHDQNQIEEALKTYRELAQKDPQTFLPKVALTLNNLGILYSAQSRIKEARDQYEEALKIYEAFATQDPEEFTIDVERLKRLLKALPK
jgi:tetratricopeptide (TPR) repeat protein